MGDDWRVEGFRRNTLLEDMLAELSADLLPAEQSLIERYRQINGMSHPLVLVMGPLRSGTTLMMQWLAHSGLFAYPTNLLSRFYAAPILGAKIQLLLTDPRFNFRNELADLAPPANFTSENGKTRGALAPNEFWYFWRRFLADPTRDTWTDDELRQSFDSKTLLAELRGVLDVFQKPFAAKGMLFNYNIRFLDALFDKVLFIQVERDPVDNVASALEARRRQSGSENIWYSFKIPEYEVLKDLDPITQTAAQVQCINRAVSEGLSEVDAARKMTVRYEDFCRHPAAVYEELTTKLGLTDCSYRGPAAFQPSRASTGQDRTTIAAALKDLGKDIGIGTTYGR